jgi:hypothetical protein
MLRSNIGRILEKVVAGDEKLEPLKRHFHGIESEIDNMANKPDADINAILRRAKELISRAFGGNHAWLESKWRDIEEDIEEELRELTK